MNEFNVCDYGAAGDGQALDTSAINQAVTAAAAAGGGTVRLPPGLGNKAIGLKNCRNVVIRGVSMRQCGHFALLATGVDHLTVEDVQIDTNRDGLDLDSCRNVRVVRCTVNAPNDDAIVLKSSYALGGARACENITISNCVFERSRGVALETVDGGVIEDVTLSDIRIVSRGGLSLEHVAQQPAEMVSPFFLRGDEPGVMGPRDPFTVPEREPAYPEPSMFGLLPASALYARHVRNLRVTDFAVAFTVPDSRPRVVLDDVDGVELDGIVAPRSDGGPAFGLRRVSNFRIGRSPGVADATHQVAGELDF